MTALASQTAPLAAEFNPHLPPALVTLIAEMLSRNPTARPGSAADVAATLLAIEEEMTTPPPPPPSKPRWRHTMVPAVVLLSCAVGVYFYLHRPKAAQIAAVPVSASDEVVLEPRDVLKRVGDRVTVEFTVKSVLRAPNGGILLTSTQENSEEFRAMLSGETQEELKTRGYNR